MASTINASSSSGIIQTADTSAILQLQTAGTTALTVDTSANVGIGTASPTGKLDIVGTGANILMNRTSFAPKITMQKDSTEVSSIQGISGGGQLFTYGSSTTEAMRIDSSGNVGIGTSSPAYKLDVQGGTTRIYNATFPSLRIQNSATGTGSSDGLLVEMSGSDALFVNYESANMIFSTANTERIRIDSSGNVIINGSTTLDCVFNVYGRNGVAPCSLKVFTNGDYGYTFKNASGTLVGAIGVNASTTSYNTSSDYRLKENIAPMTGALAKVAQLKPVTYKWKVDGSDGEGFIAHELAEVKPDCVSGDKDAVDADGNPVYQGIDTSFLVATLTAAIQELKAINDTQAETINALTARIVALESKA